MSLAARAPAGARCFSVCGHDDDDDDDISDQCLRFILMYVTKDWQRWQGSFLVAREGTSSEDGLRFVCYSGGQA